MLLPIASSVDGPWQKGRFLHERVRGQLRWWSIKLWVVSGFALEQECCWASRWKSSRVSARRRKSLVALAPTCRVSTGFTVSWQTARANTLTTLRRPSQSFSSEPNWLLSKVIENFNYPLPLTTITTLTTLTSPITTYHILPLSNSVCLTFIKKIITLWPTAPAVLGTGLQTCVQLRRNW